MLDEDSLQRLRCPLTFGKLTPADDELIDRLNRSIDAGGVLTRGGQPQSRRVQGGLVTEDRRQLYPIQDGIICMLVDGAIELDSLPDAAQ